MTLSLKGSVDLTLKRGLGLGGGGISFRCKMHRTKNEGQRSGMRLLAKITWTRDFITALTFFVRSRAHRATVGRRGIGTSTRAHLLSTATFYTALSPVSEVAPTTVHCEKLDLERGVTYLKSLVSNSWLKFFDLLVEDGLLKHEQKKKRAHFRPPFWIPHLNRATTVNRYDH